MPIVVVLSAAKERKAKLPAMAAAGRWMTRARRDNMETTPDSIMRGRSVIFAPKPRARQAPHGSAQAAGRDSERLWSRRCRRRESVWDRRVQLTLELDRLESAAKDRGRNRDQQAGGHQAPQDEHDRPLMRDQCPDRRNAGIPDPHLEAEDNQHHQRHRREREPNTQADEANFGFGTLAPHPDRRHLAW